MAPKLLLISNSTMAGEEYLAWPRESIRQFLQSHKVNNAVFLPYAGVNLSPESIGRSFDLYEDRVQKVFAGMGISLQSVHRMTDPAEAVKNAEAVIVGGGNTFHLVKRMHETGLMEAIRTRVLAGTPFVGWSAGANVACPSMKTTNDMPICEPPSFDCLNLVPFQINPHYLDANPAGHGGETREQRILEFLAVNRDMTVVGLREGCLLHVQDGNMKLVGNRDLRVFRFGETPVEYNPGRNLDFLLQ